MTLRNAFAAVLLLFVGASVTYLFAGGPRDGATGAPGTSPDGVPDADPSAGTVVTAYYFHGTMRCPTCLAIESTAREVLQQGLADDFARGAIRWRAVDFEQPEDEHYAKEFELTGASLVLVKEAGGRVVRWDNLERVWELIGDDEPFRAYVLDHARGYLNES